jgi:4-amino-4-deoxy-L-arabinose transferase-like glycosyltransferase
VSAVWIAVARPWPDHLTRTRALAFGAVVGISVLVRPFSALLLPALLAVALISRLDRRRALRFVGWATLAAAVLIAPWTIRNAVQMHAFIPVTTNIGGLLCIDNSPGATGTLRATLPYCTRGIEVDDPSRREVVTNRVDTERALRWIRAHPIGELRLLPLRLYYSYAGDSDGLRQAQIQNPADPPVATRDAGILATVASAYFFVASAFALVGSAWFLRRTAPRRLYVAIAAFALLATPLYTYGLARFHVPALPLAAVLAAPSLVALVRAARNGHRDPDPSDDARSATAEAGAHARTGAA